MIYYAALNGNNANAGTIDSPVRAISRGTQLLNPGDTLRIRGGTYSTPEDVINDYSSMFPFASGVTIEANPGEGVLMDYNQGPWDQNFPPVFLYKASNVTLKGLSISGRYINNRVVMVYGSECVNTTLLNCDITGTGMPDNAGFAIGNAAPGLQLLGCRIHDLRNAIADPWKPSGSYALYSHADRGLIEGCEFFNIEAYALHGYSGANWQYYKWIVRNCYFHEVCCNFLDGADCEIYNNRFENMEGVSFWLTGSNPQIHDNIFYNVGVVSGCSIYRDDNVGGRITNNMFYSCPPICNISSSTIIEPNTFLPGAPSPMPPDGLVVLPPEPVPLPPAPIPEPIPGPTPTPEPVPEPPQVPPVEPPAIPPPISAAGMTGAGLILLGLMMLPKVGRYD